MATPSASAVGDQPELKVAPAPEGVPKLSMAVRKNIRDEWENKRADLEARLSTLLGVPWTCHADATNVVSYAKDEGSMAKDRPGSTFYQYFESAIDRIKDFISKHGDQVKEAINQRAAHHHLTIEPSDAVNTSGCDFNGGKLRLLFSPTSLGSNVYDCLEKLDKALHEADVASGDTPLPFLARADIRKKYDPEVGRYLTRAQKQLDCKDLVLDPNFEANGKALAAWAAGGDADDYAKDWPPRFGQVTLEYFEALVERLEREKFDGDDMLREGFLDVADKHRISVRAVEPSVHGEPRYPRIVFDDGVCFIQASTGCWGINTSDAASNLMDVL